MKNFPIVLNFDCNLFFIIYSCVKNEKLKITNEKMAKIFMLNGTITIPEMKPIAGKKHAYLAEFVPKFLV